MIQCWNCGKQNISSAKFCKFCGAKLHKQKYNKDFIICPNCHRRISKNSEFCPYCGTKQRIKKITTHNHYHRKYFSTKTLVSILIILILAFSVVAFIIYKHSPASVNVSKSIPYHTYEITYPRKLHSPSQKEYISKNAIFNIDKHGNKINKMTKRFSKNIKFKLTHNTIREKDKMRLHPGTATEYGTYKLIRVSGNKYYFRQIYDHVIYSDGGSNISNHDKNTYYYHGHKKTTYTKYGILYPGSSKYHKYNKSQKIEKYTIDPVIKLTREK